MRYIKTFNESKELLNSLKDLSDKMNQLKHLAQSHRREFTTQELLEDYFLEFKESERYHINIEQKFYLITILMESYPL